MQLPINKPRVNVGDRPKPSISHATKIDYAEQAIDAAFSTGRADRAAITQVAQQDAKAAVEMVGEAMEADERADEAARLAVIAENMGDADRARAARKRARVARRAAKRAHRAATKSAKGAYDAIKFSQPGKLGFLRVVQVFYGINVLYTLFTLLMTSRDTIVYNSVTIFSWIEVILSGVAFWFFVNSFKWAKPMVIATAAFSIVANILSAIITGTASSGSLLLSICWHAFLIAYFLVSERVNEILVNDFSSFKPRRQADTEIRRSGWPFVRNLIIYFIVFSVLGHWMEAAMCQLIRIGLVQGEYDPTNTMLWRDWLYPYPMEGAAVVIIAVVLYPLWRYLLKRFSDRPYIAYILSFLANALTCTVIEFTMGLIVNADHQLWDYREMFGNIMGQVCLQNTAAFGVAASIITWIVYPLLERWLARIPNDTMNIVFVVIAVIGGILWSLYIVDPPENHRSSVEIEANQRVDVGIANTIRETLEDVSSLSDQVADSGNLTTQQRDELNARLKQINQELSEITEVLNGAAANKTTASTTAATSGSGKAATTEPKTSASVSIGFTAPVAEAA